MTYTQVAKISNKPSIDRKLKKVLFRVMFLNLFCSFSFIGLKKIIYHTILYL